MSDETVIEVEHLAHFYGSRQAIQDVSFTVRKGEIFGLLGPNGGGKTTLFEILSTLIVPTSGRARVFGQDVTNQTAAVRARIGVVFQSQSLDRKLTCLENLIHQGHLYGLSGSRLGARALEVLNRVGLDDRRDDLVENLSGGQRRRLELGKGLLHQPQLLLLDEPSTGLDPVARRELWTHLETLRERDHATILLTTHILDEAEGCDRIGILDRGRLVAMDTPDALKAQIGGDVLSARSREPERLRDHIQKRFGGNPVIVDGTVRIERARGHEFIAQLVEAFPGQIEAITVGKPTLEDVFIHCTGHRFNEEEEGAGRVNKAGGLDYDLA